ncbi:SH3 domain-containing protein [Candidatus Protochlamydia amoebophila]|nr:SH3 domain-containing protein [Candidatus Protochlamydia amoebophila]
MMFLVSFLFFFFPLEAYQEASLQQANQYYENGLRASTFQERKNAFNQALHLYLSVENAQGSSSKLNQAIADTYFQLEEYPWSILYYERAKEQNPRNSIIQEHLYITQNKLGLTPMKNSRINDYLLSSYLSFSDKVYMFFYSFLSFVFFMTIFIWIRTQFTKILSFLTGSLVLYSLLNLIISLYIIPIYAIFITSTGLYRAPSLEEPQLSTIPFLAGQKIQVIDIAHQGNWLKVIDDNHQIGYVPSQSIRII